MADHDARHSDAIAPRGFATRAIRAAHRLPTVDQAPTSVPMYQTVTFAADFSRALEAARAAADRAGDLAATTIRDDASTERATRTAPAEPTPV